MKELRILSPCGILGYGYPKESFENGLKKNPILSLLTQVLPMQGRIN